MFLQLCTEVPIFLLHFRAKMKLTLYFYFQIPLEINHPWQTSAIQKAPYPAEWDQNKATINRKKTVKYSEQPLTKNRFCPSTQERQQNDNTIPQCRSHNKFWWQIPFAESHPYSTMMTDNSRVTPYCHSHTKCKLYYKMGRDWLV